MVPVTDLAIHPTAIPGLLILDLPLHGDARGWFKENWQREKMAGSAEYVVQRRGGGDPWASCRAVGQVDWSGQGPHLWCVG